MAEFVGETDNELDKLHDGLHDELRLMDGVPSDVLGLRVRLCDGVSLRLGEGPEAVELGLHEAVREAEPDPVGVSDALGAAEGLGEPERVVEARPENDRVWLPGVSEMLCERRSERDVDDDSRSLFVSDAEGCAADIDAVNMPVGVRVASRQSSGKDMGRSTIASEDVMLYLYSPPA